MRFSVIVPTHNRVDSLARTLESLFRQDFSDNEIIVVDDGSSDGTAEYCSKLQSEGRIRYIRQSNSGPAVARNAGLKAARGTLVAFTDDDCVLPVDWLRRYNEHFQQNDIAAVGGPTRTGILSNPYADANDIIVNFLKTAINSTKHDVPFLTTNNTAYRKMELERISGFDERFSIGAEERDVNYRLRQAGGTLVYDPSIVVEHNNNANFTTFVRHQFDQGKGSYRFYRNASRHAGSKRPSMIPASVYVRLFVHPFAIRPFGRAMLLSTLIVCAQVAVTAGYVVAAMTKKPAA